MPGIEGQERCQLNPIQPIISPQVVFSCSGCDALRFHSSPRAPWGRRGAHAGPAPAARRQLQSCAGAIRFSPARPAARAEVRAERLHMLPVHLRERGRRVGDHVQHRQHRAVAAHQRDRHLALAADHAGDVAREGAHIAHQLRRLGLRCGAAHAIARSDAQAAVRPLVRPHQQRAVGAAAVEARPVEILKGVMQLAHHRRHRRHKVSLPGQQRLQPALHVGVLRRSLLRGVLHRAARERAPTVRPVCCHPSGCNPHPDKPGELPAGCR
mmetsp:Transcript_21290/g.53636  ORF Transcript_21290/g.53636 Transcript_21290/m.53636 type:complete len:268 (+) Transcript_21290:202-1005(+)